MRRRVDVAVVGAGPAGSAAAITLARGGAQVLLCDRSPFPRDKVCGDGLLPDALALLARLLPGTGSGVGAVAAGVRFETAARRELRLPIPVRVARRRDLDASLVQAAAAAGATLLLEATLRDAVVEDGLAREAVLTGPRGEVVVTADAFVLATGALPGPRRVLGLPPLPPSAAAVRGYAEVGEEDADWLLISLAGAPRRGYAWAFPGGGGLWNVGCGVFSGRGTHGSLRSSADAFLAARGGRGWQEPLVGAGLGTSFPRCVVGRGNVLAVGDAAGLARPMSGEGIGPALASGILAGECLLRQPGVAGVAAYRRWLHRRWGREQRAWRLGQQLLGVPSVVERLVAAAQGSPGVQQRLAGILAGAVPAWRVLSPLGVLRVLMGR